MPPARARSPVFVGPRPASLGFRRAVPPLGALRLHPASQASMMSSVLGVELRESALRVMLVTRGPETRRGPGQWQELGQWLGQWQELGQWLGQWLWPGPEPVRPSGRVGCGLDVEPWFP